MLIWLAIFIPVLTAIALLVFFKHKTLWWEFLLPFVASIIIIGICHMIAITSATYDTEYWGNYFVKAEYYEPWNELVHYTVQVACGTDKKGRTKYRTEHRTRVDYHPARWVGELNSGSGAGLSQEEYLKMKKTWANEDFKKLNRKYHTINGNKYETNFRESEAGIFTYFSTYSYVNKIQASKSIFKFKDVKKEDYGLFDYPEIKGAYVPSILGEVKNKDIANRTIDILNAKYGQDKKMRIWVLFFKDKPLQAGLDQQNYWMGGNKNEFVVCIGLKGDNEVDWCYPFSWSEKELLKVETRDYVNNMKPFDSNTFAQWLKEKTVKDFEKKSFKDFEYLTVEPGSTAIIVAFILTFVINIGVSIFVILNPFDENWEKTEFGNLYKQSRRFR